MSFFQDKRKLILFFSLSIINNKWTYNQEWEKEKCVQYELLPI